MTTRLILALVALHTMALAQWQLTLTGIVYGVAVHGSSVFATTPDAVHRSTDNGGTWTRKDSGITATALWQLRSVNGVLFAGTQFSSAFRSTNNGENWQNIGMASVRGFALHRDTLFAVQWSTPAVFRSVDSGATWSSTPQSPSGQGLWPIISKDQWLFIGAQFGGVFRSSDNGSTWTTVNTGLPNTAGYALARMGNYVFVGTGGYGVFRSTNNGDSWTSSSSGMGNAVVYGLHVHDTLMIAATSTRLLVSRDSGATWYTVGLTVDLLGGLASDNTYLYAGSDMGVHRRLLSQVLTNVREQTGEIPYTFRLEQNHPNPFNPSTRIPFSVHASGFTSLKVYDVLGREVATLVNEVKAPGSYEVTWDASIAASGMYLCRLTSGNHSLVKKMMLMK